MSVRRQAFDLERGLWQPPAIAEREGCTPSSNRVLLCTHWTLTIIIISISLIALSIGGWERHALALITAILLVTGGLLLVFCNE